MENGVPDATGIGETVAVVCGPAGVGKTTLAAASVAAWLRDRGKASPGLLLQSIAGLDQLRNDVAGGMVLVLGSRYGHSQASVDAPSPVSWCTGGAIPTTAAHAGSWSTGPPSAVASTIVFDARPVSLADRSWFPDPDPSFPTGGSLPPYRYRPISADAPTAFAASYLSGFHALNRRLAHSEPQAQRHLPRLNLARLARLCTNGSRVLPPKVPVCSFLLEIRQALLPTLQEDLLRLVDGIRADLCLTLVRVLNALSYCPDALNLVLALLATSRRFGHRGEAEHHGFSAFTPVPVVIGEAAGSV